MDGSLELGAAQRTIRARPGDPARQIGLYQLSGREREVMGRVAEGYTNTQIAEELRLGVKSIETYRARVMEKLGLTSRAEVVRFALECGVLTAGSPARF